MILSSKQSRVGTTFLHGPSVTAGSPETGILKCVSAVRALAARGFITQGLRLSQLAIVLLAGWLSTACMTNSAFAFWIPKDGLSILPAGTLADGKDTKWNRVVLLSTPRVASGDVEMLSASIRDTVSMFSLTILASVSETPAANNEKKFQLREVGVGFSSPVDGKQTVISSAEASKLGLSLGFVQRQMLGENEKQLRTLVPVVRTSTLTVFDAPAVLLRRQRHEEVFIRHFIYISSATGKLATLVWVVTEDEAGRLSVGAEALQLLSSGHREDRKIHVDRNEFSLLGIPSKKAFAIEQLTPGRALAWTDEAKKYSAVRKFDRDSLQSWVKALNDATQQQP